MNNDAPASDNAGESPPGRLSFGLFLLILSGFILYFAKNIRGLALVDSDPGPRALPIALGIFLLVAAVIELVPALWQFRRTGRDWLSFSVSDRMVLFTIVSLLIYLPAINLLGFSTSTVLFGFAQMWRLGSRWWVSLLVSIGLVVIVNLLFVTLFKVALPESSQGIPF